MPRNKIVKRTKKRQTQAVSNVSNVLTNVQKMEKDIIKIPAKLAARLKKEVNNHQKKETKLKKTVDKMKSLLMNAETRIASAIKNKTPTGKKRLKTAKKSYKKASKAHFELSKQLKKVTDALLTLTNRQAKLSSLAKQLNQFEKDWAKSSSSKKIKATTQAKKPRANSKSTSLSPLIEKSKIEPTEISLNTVRLDETAEVIQ